MGLSQFAYALRRRVCVPDVIVDFLCEEEILYVAIRNIGDGPAHHISVSFDPEITGIDGTTAVSDLPLFRCLAFLPPDKEIRTPLDPVKQYFDRGGPTQIQTMIQFETDTGAVLSRSLDHDLSIYTSTTRTHTH